jgi:hypothetical protein
VYQKETKKKRETVDENVENFTDRKGKNEKRKENTDEVVVL